MIDLIYLLVLLFAVITGFRKGFILALFSIIALIAGIAAALKLSASVAFYLETHSDISGKWLPIISFIIVFLLVVFLVQLGGKLIEKSFELAMLGWLSRIAGIFIYILIYTIIFSVFLFYAVKMQWLDQSTIANSKTYPYIQPLAPRVIGLLGDVIPFFKGMFEALENFFEGLSHKISH